MSLTPEQLEQVKGVYFEAHEGYTTSQTFEKFFRLLEDENFVIRPYKGEHLQYQYMPSDAGNWFDAGGINDGYFYGGEEQVIEQLKGNRGAHLGAKARVRTVSDWEEYKLPVTAEDALGSLEAYFKHNPSSTFPAGEVLDLIKRAREGHKDS